MSEAGSPLRKAAIAGGSDGEREGSDHERPERMREWIIRMVNSKRFHGLEWLNPEKDIFRVPWIHAKKRGYCKERDAALFREWAIHSGKYRDESDPTVWKINFRCAINGLKDVMEIKDMQTEDCRVYKVLPSRKSRRKARQRRFPNTEPYSHCPEIAVAPHVFNPANPNCAFLPSSEQFFVPPPPSLACSSPNIKLEYRHSDSPLPSCSNAAFAMPPSSIAYPVTSCLPASNFGPTFGQSHSGYQSFCNMSAMESVVPMQRQGSPDSIIDNQHSPLSVTDQTGGYQNMSPLHSSPSPPAYPLSPYPSPLPPYSSPLPDSSEGSPNHSVINEGSDEIARIMEVLDSYTPSPPSPPLSPLLQQVVLRIYYGSIPVHECTFVCHLGCRIFFDPRYKSPAIDEAERYFGPSGAHQIQLPENHPNQIARGIFDAMSRGLVIEMIDDDIYATPLCRTVVYCGTTATSECCSLPKEQKTKVFDYNNCFRPSLERYALANGEAPSPFAVFSLGQAWGPTSSVSQNLISISVCHCKAKHELETIGLPAALTRDLLVELPDSIEVGKANLTDLEAEAVLSRMITQLQ